MQITLTEAQLNEILREKEMMPNPVTNKITAIKFLREHVLDLSLVEAVVVVDIIGKIKSTHTQFNGNRLRTAQAAFNAVMESPHL